MRDCFVLIMLLLLLAGCDSEPNRAPGGDAGGETVRGELGGAVDAGFARADEPRPFTFPADHGPHPAFRNEWWYLVGNLHDAAGRRYGFQITFFRIGLQPGADERDSAWATNQIWMAHLALTDAAQENYYHTERFARDGEIGLAGATVDGERIWLEDWSLRRRDDGAWRLKAATEAFSLDLAFDSERGPVLHGDAGLSQKSAAPGNASYYYSLPRLATTGDIRVGEQRHTVEGTSWLDREWSTSALGDEQTGWDWFALQLDDGTDIMVYDLRRGDGEPSDYSYAAVMHPDGRVERLGAEGFRLQSTDRWTSPAGITYPSGWRLKIDGRAEPLVIEPVLAEQEFDGVVRYWEGAVDVLQGDTSAGRGYVELAGYGAE